MMDLLKNSTLQLVWMYLPPVIIVIGTVGNVLTLITMTSRSCKKSSFTTYLAALAVANTGALYMQTLVYWLRLVFGVAVTDLSAVSCKLINYLLLVSGHSSSWLIAAISLERTFCTFFPYRAKMVCRASTGYTVVGTTVGILCALNSHGLYGLDLRTENGTSYCGYVNEGYMYFSLYYFTWIDFSMYFFLPVAIIITANTATVIRVMRMNASDVVPPLAEIVRRKQAQHLLTITLLVSVAFIVCLSPVVLYMILRPFLFEDSQKGFFALSGHTEAVVYTTVFNIEFMNHANNFFLYIVSGERFRRELKLVFCKVSADATRKISPTFIRKKVLTVSTEENDASRITEELERY